jgi:hypothetical protein
MDIGNDVISQWSSAYGDMVFGDVRFFVVEFGPENPQCRIEKMTANMLTTYVMISIWTYDNKTLK